MASVDSVLELLEQRNFRNYTVHREPQRLEIFVSHSDTKAIEELQRAMSAEPFNFYEYLQHAPRVLDTDLDVSFLPDTSLGGGVVLRRRQGDEDVYVIFELRSALRARNKKPYDFDFARWAESQAQFVRLREWDRVDVENLADELEDLSKSQHRELRNRLRVLVLHLLKWDQQADRRSGSWTATVIEQRAQIDDLIRDSPSLRNLLEAYAKDVYDTARQEAVAETGLPEAQFPPELPYSIEQLLTLPLRNE